MERGLMVVVAGVATITAVAVGCSSSNNKSSGTSTNSSGSSPGSSEPGPSATSSPTTTTANASGGYTIVLNDQQLSKGAAGDVSCGLGTPPSGVPGTPAGTGLYEISAGGAKANIANTTPLRAIQITIGDPNNNLYMFDPSQAGLHVGGGDAQVIKDGNTFKITGHIALYQNTQGQTQKDATPVPFEVDATCPRIQ